MMCAMSRQLPTPPATPPGEGVYAPPHGLAQQGLIGAVKAYQLLLSPWLGSACRFTPTCSSYALQALAQHGAVAGTALTTWRLLRCHPFCEGGHDPLPQDLGKWLGGRWGARRQAQAPLAQVTQVTQVSACRASSAAADDRSACSTQTPFESPPSSV